MRWKKWAAIVLMCTAIGCTEKQKHIKIAATPVPHGEMLKSIKDEMKARGYILDVVEIDDYQFPNRMLYEKQVDANFFQHSAYLKAQSQHYNDELVPLAVVHYEPLGIYSDKIDTVADLKNGGKVAIPCDPSNETRALRFLEELHLVKLTEGEYPTVKNIIENPLNLKIEEVDAPLLTHILKDVDAAIIPANFALQAHLLPTKDALAVEKPLFSYANILVIRKEDQGREDLNALAEALTSEKMREYIEEKYQGSIKPMF